MWQFASKVLLQAFLAIAKMVPDEVGADWVSLWREFEEGATKEAVVVKHLDKFDMIAQAFEYEQKYLIGKLITYRVPNCTTHSRTV